MMRVPWIDRAKGIGLLLVILGHLVTYESSVSNWIFGFHMPLFFFLSGRVTPGARQWRGALRSIGWNLGLPYLFFLGVGLLVTAVCFRETMPSLFRIAYEATYKAQPESLHVGQLWFLVCLAGVMLLFEGIKALRLEPRREWLVVACVALLGFALGYAYDHVLAHVLVFGKPLPRPPFKLDSATVALLFFHAGHCSRQIAWEGWIRRRAVASWLLVPCLAALTVFCGPVWNGAVNLACNRYQNGSLFLVAAAAGTGLVSILAVRISSSALLEYLGKHSLPIFAGHSFFLHLYAHVLSRILGREVGFMQDLSFVQSVLGLVFVTLACLPLPMLYQACLGPIRDRFVPARAVRLDPRTGEPS